MKFYDDQYKRCIIGAIIEWSWKLLSMKKGKVFLIDTFVLEMRREDIKNKGYSPEGQC